MLNNRIGGERMESNENFEKKKFLEDLQKLLGDLIEKGIEWDPLKKQLVRKQIQAILLKLGIKSLDDVEGLMNIYHDINKTLTQIPIPKNYPDIQTFKNNFNKILEEKSETISSIPIFPSADKVALLAQGDWKKLRGRESKEIEEYLYDLGKVLSSEFVYTMLFDETDNIEVGENWEITNGRHRALTLKVLGPDYVRSKIINQWVKVEILKMDKNN